MCYTDIEIPTQTADGFVICVLGGVLAFSLIWHIWWLAIFAFLGMAGTAVARAFQDEVDYIIPAAQVAEWEAQPRIGAGRRCVA